MEHIDLRIGETSGMANKKIKVFCLSKDNEREEYEELINAEDVTILEETGPTLDKIGRVLVIVK